MDDLIAMEGTTQDQQLDHHHLEEGDQNLQSVSGGGEAANLPLLPEKGTDESSFVKLNIFSSFENKIKGLILASHILIFF